MAEEKKDEFFDGMDQTQAPWFKFVEIGDAIKGIYLSKRYAPPTKDFGGQWVYELKVKATRSKAEENAGVKEGDIVSLGIGEKKTGTLARLKNVQVGQVIGFNFESITPSVTKGFHDTHNIATFVIDGIDPDYDPVGQEFPGAEPVEEKDDVPFK